MRTELKNIVSPWAILILPIWSETQTHRLQIFQLGTYFFMDSIKILHCFLSFSGKISNFILLEYSQRSHDHFVCIILTFN